MKTRLICLILASSLLASCAAFDRLPSGKSEEKKLSGIEFRNASEVPVIWTAEGVPQSFPETDYAHVKILGINDLHGHLNGHTFMGRPLGGAAVLASYLKAEEAEAPGRTFIVHAGDVAGASPPVSALLQDEPTVGFLNMLASPHCSKNDLKNVKCNVVGTLGNHEFDDGRPEMMRLIQGGPYKDGSGKVRDWEGASFPHVSANVVVTKTGKTLLPPYVILEADGEKIAFIGAVLEGVASIVMPSAVEGLTILDEAEAINSYIPELQEQGVRAIVVLIHQGIRQNSFGVNAVPGQGDLVGNIIDITQRFDGEVDLVVSGHAHGYTNLLVPNQSGKDIQLVQAYSYSTAYDDIEMVIDRATGDVVQTSTGVISTWGDQGPGLTPDPQVAAFVAAKNKEVEPLVTRVVGEAAVDLRRQQSEAGESPLGQLIADANRAATGSDMAFIMMGGVRADIDQGPIEWGDVLTLLPFGNQLMTMSLTGAQIERVLRQQWHEKGRDHVLQASGLHFVWDAAKPWDQRLVSYALPDGSPLEADKLYRVTVTNFHAAGGDGFTVFKEGTQVVPGAMDMDAFIDYLKAQGGPVMPSAGGRIKRLN